jgi:hypothetical protein
LDPDLDTIHVVALGGGNILSGSDPLGGTLLGAAELRRFITDVGLDSVVAVRQLRDLPDPAFEYTFHLLPADQIVAHVQGRLAAVTNAEMCIIAGVELTADDQQPLEPFDSFVLGASSVRPEDGVRRVAEWFSRRS